MSASKCDPARLRSNVSWWRPDCVAGVRGLELRNVVANYPFESSRGFPRSEPNSGHGDHSRLSCSAGDTHVGTSASVLHGRWPSCGVAEKARIGRDLFRSEDDPPAAKPTIPLLRRLARLDAAKAASHCTVPSNNKRGRLPRILKPGAAAHAENRPEI